MDTSTAPRRKLSGAPPLSQYEADLFTGADAYPAEVQASLERHAAAAAEAAEEKAPLLPASRLGGAAAWVRRSPSDVALWLLVLVCLRGVVHPSGWLPPFPRALQLVLSGLLLAFGGLMFTRSGRMTSAFDDLPGASWSSRRAPTPRLLTSDVFALCRHPQYCGLGAFCLGLCLLSQATQSVVWTLVLVLVLDKKADLEEAELAKKFPDYAHYLLQTPKFLPGLRPVARCACGAVGCI